MFSSIAALALFGIVWGATMPLTKISMSTGHHPFGLIFWQLVISAALLTVVVIVRQLPLRWTRRHVMYYLIIAFVGTLIPNTFSLLAIRQLPAGVMAIVIATVPLFSLLLAWFFRIEKPTLIRLTGIVLGVVALMLIAIPEASLPEPDKASWLLVALLAPICYGIEGIYIAARAPRGISSVSTLLGASLVGSLIIAPVVFSGGFMVNLLNPWGAPELALLASGIGHVTAYGGYLWLVGRAGPVFSSQIAYVATISGVLVSFIILNERYSGWVLLSVVLMLVALSIVRPLKQEAQ